MVILLVKVGWALARRPRLWPAAARAYVRHIPNTWWTRRPFLPVPDATWTRFRLETMYGGDWSGPLRRNVDRIRPEDVVSFITWCRGMDRLCRDADRMVVDSDSPHL